MTHVGYLVAGYTITFGAIGVYVAWVLARSRAVARLLETQRAEERPMTRAGPG